MIVENFQHVLDALIYRPPPSKLFCFFAFDERPSHRVVLDFLSDAAYWIDHLSAQSGVRSIIVAEKWSGPVGRRKASVKNPFEWLPMERPMTELEHLSQREERAFVDTLDQQVSYVNPSVTLAYALGVDASSLPGVIFFRALSSHSVAESLFAPLNVDVFKDGLRSAERIIVDLFSATRSAVDSAKPNACNLDRLLGSLQEHGIPAELKIPSDKDLEEIVKLAWKGASSQRLGMKRSPVLPPEEVRKDTKVFISYAREDIAYAVRLFVRLEEAGFRPWIDEHSLLPGESWGEAIDGAIRSADFFIACLSRDSVAKRGYVQREFRKALDLWTEKLDSDIYLIPVRLDDCEVPVALSRFQWVDFHHGAGWPDIMRAITEGLRRRGRIV